MPIPTGPTTSQQKGKGKLISRVVCMVLTLVFMLSILPGAGAITQQQINDLKSKQAQLASDKQKVQNQLANIRNEKEEAVARKSLLEQKLDVTRQELEVVNQLISDYDNQIAEKTVELEEAQKKVTLYTEKFLERIRYMEEHGDVSYWSVLFSSEDFADLLDNMNAVSEIMDYDNHVIDELQKAKDAVAEAKATLETARSEQQTAKQQLETYKADLVSQEREVEAMVAQIRAQESTYSKELHEMEGDEAGLASDIAAAEKQYKAQIQEQQRKAAEEKKRQEELARQKKQQQQQQSNNNNSSSSSKDTSTTSVKSGSGGYIWPLPSGNRTITSPYGNRNCPYHGKEYHSGVDVSAPKNTKVYAAKAGTVILSTFGSSYGNYIVIVHGDGSKTLYAHMNSRAVSSGTSVSQGQVIGYVGMTGSATGNHLHFEVWTGSSSSSRVNPMNYF